MVAVGEGQLPAALAGGGGHPDAHEVAPRPLHIPVTRATLGAIHTIPVPIHTLILVLVIPVLVRGSTMQDVLIVQELDLAGVHDHVHLQSRAHGFDDVGGFELGGGERGNEAGVGEAGGGAEEVRVESSPLRKPRDPEHHFAHEE